MGKKIKKLLSIVLSLALVTSIAGCTSGEKKTSMGRYVEERYEAPKEVWIQNMTKLNSGNIAMVSQTYLEDKVGLTYYLSEDGGKTWSESFLDLPKQEGKDIAIMSCVVLPNEKTFINYYFMEPWVEPSPDEEKPDINLDKEDMFENIEYKYALIGKDGSFEEIQIELPETENSDEMYYGMHQVKAASNGDLFITTGEGNKIIQFDGETFEEKNIFEQENYFNDFIILEKSLVVYGFDSIIEYDLENGTEKGNLEKLEKEVISDNVQYYPTFINSGSKEKLYYYTALGLYEYDMTNQSIKQLIDGALSSFGNRDMYLTSFVEKENGEFLATFDDWSNGGMALINFSYDPNIPSVPDKQLRVYSLLENDAIRQAVGTYSKLNPDTYVKYEVGLTMGAEGVTELDALKTLNTEIAAGNGPDVIVLDGLPVDSYIEKGLLEDISEIINEYTVNDSIFKNLGEAYTVDGKIYQFPTRFKFPILMGEKEFVDTEVKDLNSFVELAKKAAAKYPDKRVFDQYYSPKTLAYSLYYLFGNDWLNADNTINVDTLDNFFEQGKILYTTLDENMKRYQEKMESIWNDKFQGEDIPDKGDGIIDEDFEVYPDENGGDDFVNPDQGIWDIYDMNYYLMGSVYPDSYLMDDPAILMFGSIDTWSYQSLVTALLNNKNLDYKLMTRGEEKIFAPSNNIGINAKGKNKEDAKAFIKELFAEKENNRYYGEGLPVNKNDFKKQFVIEESEYYKPEFDEETQHYFGGTMGWSDENGTMKEIKMYLPNEDDINKIIGEIESLDTAATANRVLLTEVAKQFEQFVLGEVSKDDAINTIVDNLDLYLAE